VRQMTLDPHCLHAGARWTHALYGCACSTQAAELTIEGVGIEFATTSYLAGGRWYEGARRRKYELSHKAMASHHLRSSVLAHRGFAQPRERFPLFLIFLHIRIWTNIFDFGHHKNSPRHGWVGHQAARLSAQECKHRVQCATELCECARRKGQQHLRYAFPSYTPFSAVVGHVSTAPTVSVCSTSGPHFACFVAHIVRTVQ